MINLLQALCMTDLINGNGSVVVPAPFATSQRHGFLHKLSSSPTGALNLNDCVHCMNKAEIKVRLVHIPSSCHSKRSPHRGGH